MRSADATNEKYDAQPEVWAETVIGTARTALVQFRHIVRFALVFTTICVTVGASGMFATMSWQVPGEARAATEIADDAVARTTTRSFVMTAAYAYIDGRSAAEALQAAAEARSNLDPSTTSRMGRSDITATWAQFEGKCLKKRNKRRHAKLVSAPCRPMQAVPSVTAAIEAEAAPSTVAAPSRKARDSHLVQR